MKKETMKAIKLSAGRVACADVPMPPTGHPDRILVKVERAAICRTDVYAARGVIQTADPVVLGHEFSGTVVEKGTSATRFSAGDRIAVMPIIGCRSCPECRSGRESVCQHSTMLGIDYDGAFAQYVSIPERMAEHLPANLSFEDGAYAEPVAAALGVVTAGMQPEQRGAILGSSRIAFLVKRVLEALDFDDIDLLAAGEGDESSYDFVIETQASEEIIAAAVRLAKPRGTVVLKSRQFKPVPFHLIPIVKKELSLKAVHYAPFSQALELLGSGRLKVSDLVGTIYPLSGFEQAFAEAEIDERNKLFFDPWQ